MLVAVYCRKSTEQTGIADEQKSVARQIEHARAYAERKGWRVLEDHVYVDDGISGAEFSNRPGFRRLMAALAAPPFQALIMSEESRLGREAIETMHALKRLVQAGVRVFSYLEDREVTLGSFEANTMTFLRAQFAAEEREKARQRTYDALARKARNGYVVGGRTFGYTNIRTEAGVTRGICEPEAAVVRRIFGLCANGIGYSQIAKLLNDERAVAPAAKRGPGGWAPSSVRDVLFRRLYRGEIVWNRSKKRDRWGVKRQAPRPAEEWLEQSDPALRIVSEAMWCAAHDRIAGTRARFVKGPPKAGGRPPGHGVKFLLTGLLVCGVCGGSMEARSRAHGQRGRRVYFYGCSAYHRRGRTICPNSLTVPVAHAERAVIATVEDTLLDEAVITTAIGRAAARIRARTSADGPVSRLQSELAELDEQLERLTTAIATGGEVPVLVTAIRTREYKRQQIQRDLALLEAMRATVPEVSEVRQRIELFMADWQQVLTGHPSQAHRLLSTLIDGRLMMTPEPEQQRYRVTGRGSLRPVLAGLVPQNGSSPTGFDNLWTLELTTWIDRHAA